MKLTIHAYLSNISESFIKLIRDIENQGDVSYIKSAFVYTFYTLEGLTKQEIISIFRQVSLKTEQITMSIAEELKIEGKIEGKKETTVRFVKGMLKVGMDASTIAATFDLPKAEVEDMIAKIQKGLL